MQFLTENSSGNCQLKIRLQMAGVLYNLAIDNFDQQVNIAFERLLAELHSYNCAESSLHY